jgi:predicted histidine transporter YuiF (NhaC family)
MNDRTNEIIGGIFIFTVSAGLYFYNWYLIENHDYYYPKAAFFGGLMMIVGLALILIPNYRAERKNRGENIDNLSGMQLLTPKWWAILAAALAFGIANWIYAEFFINS